MECNKQVKLSWEQQVFEQYHVWRNSYVSVLGSSLVHVGHAFFSASGIPACHPPECSFYQDLRF